METEKSAETKDLDHRPVREFGVIDSETFVQGPETSKRSGGHPHIYLDHNATAPISLKSQQHVMQWLKYWGNSSSIHTHGRGPKRLLRESRQKLANAIGVSPLEIIFTSGGSEANNLALKGIFEATGDSQRNHFLISSVEHPSVYETALYLKKRGAQVEWIPVSKSGAIDLTELETRIHDKTALVSVMMVNNETGNIFPVKKIAKLAHQKGALFHTDAVQALGKIPLHLSAWDIDLASFSGHKFYALKGVGALYVRRGISLESQTHGGPQERGRRAGTENILAISSLGAMCEYADEIAMRNERVRFLRDRIELRVMQEIKGVQVTGLESPRVSNTSHLVIEGVDGETLLMNLDVMGFSVSTGAACSSGAPQPSRTLLAMGLSRRQAQSSLRLSLGWTSTLEQIDRFVEVLKVVVCRQRRVFRGSDSPGEIADSPSELTGDPK